MTYDIKFSHVMTALYLRSCLSGATKSTLIVPSHLRSGGYQIHSHSHSPVFGVLPRKDWSH